LNDESNDLTQFKNQKKIRTITLEEAYATPAFLEGPGKGLKVQAEVAKEHPQSAPAGFAHFVDQLIDIDEGRIKEMDQAGIDVQVLSLTSPGVEQLNESEAVDLANESNDYLAKAIKKYPKRFVGFATLPTPAPEKAADKLEHMVKKQGFRGAIINGHVRGRYLDDEFFWPILERAEELNVPIYLHPTMPPEPVINASYTGNFDSVVSNRLATAWGWHIETATHILRIILSGAFDQYPNLQFIIGHMGEGLPFMLPRANHTLTKEITKLERPVSDYLRENVYYTFSGWNYTPIFLNLFLEVGADRIMFSADYPMKSMEWASTFLDQLPVSKADKEKIAHRNAERLLGIRYGP
jgi:hypothetical protein